MLKHFRSSLLCSKRGRIKLVASGTTRQADPLACRETTWRSAGCTSSRRPTPLELEQGLVTFKTATIRDIAARQFQVRILRQERSVCATAC